MRISDTRPAISGDDEARARLTQLWVDHKPAVEAFARRRSNIDADDVVQQVFVTAWRRLADVPDEPRAGRRWDALAVRMVRTVGTVPTVRTGQTVGTEP